MRRPILPNKSRALMYMVFGLAFLFVVATSLVVFASCQGPGSSEISAHDLYPEPDSTKVNLTSTISVVFSEGPGAIELQAEPKVDIAYVKREALAEGGTRVIFYPSARLQFNTTYDVSIAYTSRDGSSSEVNWQFTTWPQPVPVNVHAPLPRSEAKDVPVDTTVSVSVIRYSGLGSGWDVELIMEPEVDIGEVTIQKYGVASAEVTFHPETPLLPVTSYTAIVAWGPKETPSVIKPTDCVVCGFTTGPAGKN